MYSKFTRQTNEIEVYLWFQNGGHTLLEIKDQYGKTAVHYAAARCNVEVSFS